MAGVLSLDFEVLHERANEFKNESEEVNALIGRLDSLLNSLESEWQGQTSVAFANQYEDARPGIVKLEELLASISEQLHKVSSNFQDVDQNMLSGA